jgi:hypothetical protein
MRLTRSPLPRFLVESQCYAPDSEPAAPVFGGEPKQNLARPRHEVNRAAWGEVLLHGIPNRIRTGVSRMKT